MNDTLEQINEIGTSPRAGTKVAIQFSPDALAMVDWLADSRGGVPRGEAVRLALADERYFLEAAKSGQRIFIERGPPGPGRDMGRLVEVDLLKPR